MAARKAPTIPSEMKNALDAMTRQAYGDRIFLRAVQLIGPQREPQAILNPATEHKLFELALQDVNNIEDWVVSHPLLGWGRNYQLHFIEPEKNTGLPRKSASRIVPMNLADPAEQMVSAMQNNAVALERKAQAEHAVATHEAMRAEAVASTALARINEIKALKESDPQAYLERVAEMEKEIETMASAADSAQRAIQNFVATANAANIARAAAPPAQGQQTPLNPNGLAALGGMPWSPQMPPNYPPFNPYAMPPYWQPQTAAPAQDNGTAKALESLVQLFTVQMQMQMQMQRPAQTAGIPDDVQRQIAAQNQAMAEMRAEVERARARAEQAERDARHAAEMSELKAQLAALANRPKDDGVNFQLEMARLEQANRKAEADRMQQFMTLLTTVQSEGTNRLLTMMQNSGDDDTAEQMRKMMAVQGEIFANGIQVMRMVGQARGDGGAKAEDKTDQLIDKIMASAAMLLTPQHPQAQEAPQYAPPPQYEQQPQYAPPAMALPSAPAQPEAPPIPPPRLGVVPQEAPAAPLLLPQQWADRARAHMAAGRVKEAFADLFAGFQQHPSMLEGQHEFAAARAIFMDVMNPNVVSNQSIEQAIRELRGEDGVAVLRQMFDDSQPAADAGADADEEEPEAQEPVVVAAPAPTKSTRRRQ